MEKALNARIEKEFERELEVLLRKILAISNNAKKESQAAFGQAAPILISAIQARADQSDKPHFRYNTPKVATKLRAPNGMGVVVAKYMPGNLKRSFKTLIFRKSAAVFVGPKLDKSGSGGTFSGNKTDGYYAHWMEYGAPEAGIEPRPFVRPAVAAAGPQVLRFAAELLKRIIEKNATR